MNQEAGESTKPSGPLRPPRRSGPRRRGGRGRRPEKREQILPQPQASSPIEQTVPAQIADKPAHVPAAHQQRHQPKQSALSPIAAATAHVEEIIQTLKDSLRDLEEVLEILDDAQRQQIGDAKEIESLRRSLSVLQRERQSVPREESRGRFENRGRSENRNRSEEQRSPAKSSPAEPPEPEE